MGRLVKGLAFFLILFLSSKSWGYYTEKGINFWTAPDHTRIVIALKQPAKPYISNLGKTIVISFKGRIRPPYKRLININDPLVDRIQIVNYGNLCKVYVRLKRPNSYRLFVLRRYKNRPFRIVLDVLKPAKEILKEKEARIKIGAEARRRNKYVVVIDPGHGGMDPGAIGLYGLVEKDLVLDISRRVVKYCNQEPNIKALLTRNGDYYIPLDKRVEIAHEYGADLFISIHSNKAPSRKVKGVMAFVLSPRGAKSNLARMLENIENAEDIVKDIKFTNSRNINKIVLDTAQEFSVTEGERAAKITLAYITYMSHMKNMGIRKASLRVLKNPGIPSFLLELGFMSNSEDAAKLTSPSFRDRVAYAICRGIVSYFNFRDRIKRVRYYMVKKGDTLWKIARDHKTTVDKLMALNNLKSKKLYPGMKLYVP